MEQFVSRRNLVAGVAGCVAGITALSIPTPAQAANNPDIQTLVEGLSPEAQECITIYEDGSGFLVDTNPHDKDGGDYTYMFAGNSALSAICDALGISKTTQAMFNQCSASDGWQTRTRNGVEVTWKYHPDSGLRVFFEFVS